MKNLLYTLLFFSLCACGGKSSNRPANQLAANDFESVDGWLGGPSPASLTKEKAHSGQYSVKVDPSIDFSLGYNNTLGKMSASKLEKIKVHAWVFLPNDKATVALVTEVKNPQDNNKGILWEGIDLQKEAKGLNKWVEVEKVITLPQPANYNNQLLVYLWRSNSSQPAYMDDVEISRVE